ncbi:unannotated protein [freshwater metagenome]|uniref:Unannotated protein n=1 Tax=freshwater metagenome TaxID=449393 RepID=A0A6J6X608_9ZZZZ
MVAAALGLFDAGGGAHLDAAAAGAVGVDDAGAAQDGTTRWEVGAQHKPHQVIRGGLWVVDEVDGCVDDLAQVVRRDVRGHTDRDALAAVDQQVGESSGKNRGFFAAAVVCGHHVDGFFVDVGQQLHCQRVQATLGVSAGCRTKVGRAVVAVEVDERVTHREWLGHTHQGVVDGAVAVRVVLGHRVAADASRLHERTIRTEALLFHVPDDAAVHRLETVAHVGQGASHDDRHCVVKEAAFHFVLQRDGLHRQ